MKKEVITLNQAISLVAMFVLGSSLMLGLSRESKQDTWMALLIAMAAVLPVIYIYARLMARYPGMNLFDICTEVFGKLLGKIVVALFIWYALHLGALVFRNFSEYTQVRVFPEMPPAISLLSMAVLAIWVSKRGMEALGRCAAVLLPIVLLIIAGTTAMLAKDMHPSYLLPVGENLSSVPKDAFTNFSFPFAETVLFLGLLNHMKQGGRPGKVWLYGILIGGFALLLAFFRNALSLGFPSLGDKWFPSYEATSLIIIGTFISRIENIVGANLVLLIFVKAAVCLLVAAKGCAKLFDADDYRPYVAPLGLLMAAFAAVVYKSTMEMFDFVPVYPYYAFPFEVIFPLALCITAEIRLIGKSRKERGGAQPSPA